ncbi:baseplate wedge protein 53 [Porticoccaceae bacterium]|nr:baseplate wedge protein 53 [Porticoccaceae bacterium]
MSNYFSYFPTTDHDLTNIGQKVKLTNIMRRFKVQSELSNISSVYYEYDIQDGDRPDTVAEKYYGDSKYAWLVLHFSNIKDVHFDWPLSTFDFEEFIKGKYGSIEAAQAETQEYRIYLSKVKDGVKVPAEAEVLFDGTSLLERVVVVDEATYNRTASNYQKAVVSKYDYEVELNEERRSIRLLDKRYLSQVRDEVEDILRNGV